MGLTSRHFVTHFSFYLLNKVLYCIVDCISFFFFNVRCFITFVTAVFLLFLLSIVSAGEREERSEQGRKDLYSGYIVLPCYF